MRYSSNHKAETRQRIIGEAARRFRKHGIEGTGLVPLMKALGLTHGGFYAHFESKDALVQASLEAAAEQTLERWQAPPTAVPTAVPAAVPAVPELAAAAGDEPVRAFIDDYLSAHHRDEPGEGCPLPTLAAELGLRGQPSATADAMIEQMTALLADCRIAAGPGDGGIVALAAMVGALTLARAVSDRAASDGILAAVRAALQPAPREA
jgi:TetR/AcrR family transcriptional regulator, transcriptional repressor for nem operon